MSGRGIRTSGIGKPHTGHLNLTKSLAHFWSPREATVPASKFPVRLVDDTGMYLHQSAQAMTREPAYAWQGNDRQLAKVRNCVPLAAGLKAVRVIP